MGFNSGFKGLKSQFKQRSVQNTNIKTREGISMHVQVYGCFGPLMVQQTIFREFNVHGSVHRKNVLIYV